MAEAKSSAATTESASDEFLISRVLDAPCTEPERVTQWWSPRGFTNPGSNS